MGQAERLSTGTIAMPGRRAIFMKGMYGRALRGRFTGIRQLAVPHYRQRNPLAFSEMMGLGHRY